MDDSRPVIYCLVPEASEDDLLGDLRAHFASDDRVHVIVERRKRERRASARGGLPSRSAAEEQSDRRSGSDRRRPQLQRWTVDVLPPHLQRRANGVRFVQRMLPVTGGLSNMDIEDIVAQVRRGNAEAPTELYWRVYASIHSRLCVLLGDPESADNAAPTGFGRILDAIEADTQMRPFDELMYKALDAAFRVADAADGVQDEDEEPPTLAITDPTLDEMVHIKDRDPRWFERGMSERDKILRLAGSHVLAVEHIGSTGVPAIAARPIVDMLVGVERMQESAALRAVLLSMGYERCGNGGTRGRAYYRRRGVLNYDVHVVEYDGPLWRDAIGVREFLRRSPSEAARWANAKREAAKRGGHSLLAYDELRRDALRDITGRALDMAQRAA
jgi:GrpB-like predicted nucleotidyltransferase (UPF0157 family)